MPTNDIRSALVASVSSRASDALGFQVSKGVNVVVDGLINALIGESIDDKRAEMNAHHDKMLEIVQKTPLSAPRIRPMISPREQIEKDVHESNDHIRTAMEELQKAHSLTKCGVCKETIGNTINYVGAATGEILDASEKVLAMQKLKDIGEIDPTATWDDLNKNQKQLVGEIIQQYHPLRTEEFGGEEESEVQNGKKVSTRKPAKRKPKSLKTIRRK